MKKRKTMKSRWQILFVSLFLLAGCMLLGSKPVLAADNEIKINSCKLNQNGRKLTVKATVKKKKAAMGKNLYLIGLDSYQSSSGKTSAKPIAELPTRKGSIVFTVKYDSKMLCQQFVVAYKSGGKYKIASNASYITNPEVLASYKGTGAKTHSKKGLYADYGEVCDPIALGTQHVVMNWTINEMFRTIHTTRTIAYKYRGTTYYFDADVMDYHDSLVGQYVASGARVYVILLLRYGVSADTASMCYKGSGASFSSINITNKKGCLAWEALMTYLGQRYATKDNLISGWVLGNEVDSPGDWNYGGGKSLSAYMTDYAAAYRICYNAVKSNSKNSNIYISLDYNWNQDMDGGGNAFFTTKKTLDTFYTKIKNKGKIGFHIAYHAYSQGLVDPEFWDDWEATNSSSSKIITMNNIGVLTSYVKKKFGSSCKIMLAEQSFNANHGENVQAATYAYAYYKSECDSMIEVFAYGREFDTEGENNEGIYWGLSDKNHNKRLVWNIFKYIDCDKSLKYTNSLASCTNLKAWTKISSNLKKKIAKFPKRASACGQVEILPFGFGGYGAVQVNWRPVAGCDGYKIYRDGKVIKTVDASSGTTSYIDTGLKEGTIYNYQIRAYKNIAKYDFSGMSKTIYGKYSKKLTWVGIIEHE